MCSRALAATKAAEADGWQQEILDEDGTVIDLVRYDAAHGIYEREERPFGKTVSHVMYGPSHVWIDARYTHGGAHAPRTAGEEPAVWLSKSGGLTPDFLADEMPSVLLPVGVGTLDPMVLRTVRADGNAVYRATYLENDFDDGTERTMVLKWELDPQGRLVRYIHDPDTFVLSHGDVTVLPPEDAHAAR